MGKCSVENCERECKAKGYCLMHYKRVRKHGDANFIFKYSHRRDEECKIQGCNRSVNSLGYCSTHYHANRKYGDPLHREKKRKEIRIRESATGRRWRIGSDTYHRVIIQRHIGRKLEKGECVHHIDCDPYNNEVSNLYVFKSQKEHNRCHTQLQKLAKELIRTGVLTFKDGEYIINKRQSNL